MRNDYTSDHTNPDAALIALGRELEAAMAEEERLPTSETEALDLAFARTCQVIKAIDAIDARTEEGKLVKIHVIARQHIDLAYLGDDELDEAERPMASIVRLFFPEPKREAKAA